MESRPKRQGARSCIRWHGDGNARIAPARYTWDPGNRLTGVADSTNGTTTLVYDDLNHITSVTSPQGTVSYTADAIGRRQTMTVAGQPQITYTYDAANHLIQIAQGTGSVQFTYDELGRRSSVTLPTGVVSSYSYNTASQLLSITYSKDTAILGDLEYAYDAAGRRSAFTGSLAKTLLPQTVSGNAYNAANQLTQASGMTINYDANGNITSDGVHTYSWNARNQLVSVDAGGAATFGYDGFGRRVLTNIAGAASTSFVYDGANPVQEIVSGSPNANMITGGIDEYLVRTDAGGMSGVLADASGSTIGLTDASGTIQTQYNYDPYGGTVQSGSSSSNTFAFTGRESDVAGLYFYRARYYNPNTGRFLSEDPTGLSGGINEYAYAAGDPINWSDPFGAHRGDKWYGYDDRDFQDWYHRNWKEPGDKDATKEDLKEAYDEWEREEKPVRDSKGARRKGGRNSCDEEPEPEPIAEPEPALEPEPDSEPKPALDPQTAPESTPDPEADLNPLKRAADYIASHPGQVAAGAAVVIVGGTAIVLTGGAAAPLIFAM